MNRETSAVAEAMAGQATKGTKKCGVDILNSLEAQLGYESGFYCFS
jgi:hypothetical protein